MDIDLVQIVEILLESSTSSESSNTSTTTSESSEQTQQEVYENFEEVIANYSTEDFLKHFQMKKSTVNSIIEKYSQTESFKIKLINRGGRAKISAKKEIYVFLWYLASTEPYRVIGKIFGVSTHCAWQIINRVTAFVISLGHHFIKWPSEIYRTERLFESRAHIPGVIGAIDCSDIRIKPPSGNNDDYYNQNKMYSIRLQAVVGPDKQFYNIYIGEPGSFNNSEVLRRSALYQELQENVNFFGDRYFIIGDSTYPCLDNLVAPYTGQLKREQKKFNCLHATTRIVVKQAFDLLYARFKRLQSFINHQNINIVVNITTAGCILHNICLQNDDNISFVTIDEYPSMKNVLLLVESSSSTSISLRRDELLQSLIGSNVI